MDLKIIGMEDEAFYRLVETVVARLKSELARKALPKWIDAKEAMNLLKIKSPTTLANLRNEGKIRFSQPMTKVLLYDSESILKYIEKHAQEPFT